MNISWLDGQDSKGQFVLRIEYRNGGTAFLKNPSLDSLVQSRDLYCRHLPEIKGTTIFDPEWRRVA